MPAGKRFFPRVEQARWLLWLPAAVLIAFVLSLGGMFYVVFFDWQDERRDSLIQDILWLEQSMRSQLTEQQDWAVRTASEVGEGTLDEDRFQAASELILRENPEILSVELLNAQGQVEARAPSQFQAEHRRQPLASFEERDAFDVARRQGQIMGDHHQRHASLIQLAQQRHHLISMARVQAAGGLVGNHQRGLRHQGTGNRHPLFLPAR